MAIPASSMPTPSDFPTAAVMASLEAELTEAVRNEAAIKGVPIPADSAGIIKTSFQIDSLVVLTILCTVEPVLGVELPESVVRTGGYASIRSALDHLLPRIEAEWRKCRGVGR